MTGPILPGGIDLSRQGVPPKEQRILAPSLVGVEKSGGYASQCVCSVRIVDPINLVVYYVPMTIQMVEQLREQLEDVGMDYHNNAYKENHDK